MEFTKQEIELLIEILDNLQFKGVKFANQLASIYEKLHKQKEEYGPSEPADTTA